MCWFGCGFLVARHHHAIIGTIVDRRWLSASFALLVTVLLYVYSWHGGNAAIGSYDDMTPLYKTAILALAWSMILAATGFAARHLNRKSPP
ncbi:MAG: hypothetical protein ABWZ83_06340 [Mesorhizobium sp.]